MSKRIALVGDFDRSLTAHRAINESLRLAGVDGVWIHTSLIMDAAEQLSRFGGIWVAPASPYANMDGALQAIRYAREEGRPFLGTCGGFQHAVIEYARNVCGMATADHAETNPEGPVAVISPLECSLVEQSEQITLVEGTMIERAYGERSITEGYHCSYGLNPKYAEDLFRDGLRATAHGADGEVRAMELDGHPFFAATLFQPERRALAGKISPLVEAFLVKSSQ